MTLEEINSIILEKWEELETEENTQEEIEEIIEHNIHSLKEIFLQLDALKDFQKEYDYFLEHASNEQEEIPETEEEKEGFKDFILEKIIQKWCFLFCGIINLDIANNMNIFYARKALEKILEEK